MVPCVWTPWSLKSPTTGLFGQQPFKDNQKERIKAPCFWPFVVEIPPLISGPVERKASPCQNVMGRISTENIHRLSKVWLILLDKELQTQFYIGEINHPCPNFNGGSTELPLKLKDGWVIASHFFMRCIIHCAVSWPQWNMLGLQRS